MRNVRSIVLVCALLGAAAPAGAQVSCADPANLCTGDPCVTTNVTVQSPCVVDFGNRALVIGGALTVPSGGTLSFTANSIEVQGRIEAPAATVDLIGTLGAVLLRTEVDVGAGSFTATAASDIDAKTRLKAKGGGSITLDAGGTLTTHVAAVIETMPGGTVTLAGDTGVTVGGKVVVGETASGSIQITSDTGGVTIDQDLRASGDPPSTVTIDGMNGIVLRHAIVAAGKSGPGGSVTLTSGSGVIDATAKVRVSGLNGGSFVATAPGGAFLRGILAHGHIDGGSVSVSAANISVMKKIVAQGNGGNGGSIELYCTNLITVVDPLDADGKVDGGIVQLTCDPLNGAITVEGAALTATGGAGNGGTVFVSAPAGLVQLFTKSTVAGKGGTGGLVHADAATLSVGPKARFIADGGTAGGEIRFAQSGPASFQMNGTFQARAGGTIEALAPSGSLTVQGKLRVDTGGCIGLSAGMTLNLTSADPDVSVTPSCP